ncbi:hypothetical protein Nepgr_032907 [Nepenthes gracilis]|uniref:TCP domain-containing protein n=1 Tax=Nepenthes gracilis TaxID=150966 RepID=A0AAD3Y889_NEPGR|nr:hypothetical protein Nepgr_032907 [Nepenthes gracilis]
MEVDDIQTQACKFSKVGSDKIFSNKIGIKGSAHQQYLNDQDGEVQRAGVRDGGAAGGGGGGGGGNGVRELGGRSLNGLRGWQHSSRIIRVSRASGGKDRHSKVWTAKGPRDRRVRLSVPTAIQFYDLQDRLGFDQPSKAVEWLIKAAADDIAKLPSLNSSFPDTPRQPNDDRRPSTRSVKQALDSAEVELEGDPNLFQSQQKHGSSSKSACSSTSETSKGSGLSISRPEVRVKGQKRARERTAKEKERENDSKVFYNQHQNVDPLSYSSSFTQLLTGGIGNVGSGAASSSPSGHDDGGSVLSHKTRQWQFSPAPMEYFNTGLISPSSSRASHSSSGFSGQIHLGNSIPPTMTVLPFSLAGNHQPEQQHFSFGLDHKPFVPDHLLPVPDSDSGIDYNLNFTISSSGIAGFNRGTLQSNSPSLLPHLQRFPALDGSSIPFFLGAAAVSSAAAPAENHHHQHQHQQHFPSGLQLCYGDGEKKGKGKN